MTKQMPTAEQATWRHMTTLEAVVAAVIDTAVQAGAKLVRITTGIVGVTVEDDGKGWREPGAMIRAIAGYHAVYGSMCQRMNIARMLWEREVFLTSRPKDGDGFSLVLDASGNAPATPDVQPSQRKRVGSAVLINLESPTERRTVAENIRWAACRFKVPVVLDGVRLENGQ